MPDRVQDLKNHRQVAMACKNYTDSEIKKSEGRILSIVARNNVDFIDHIDEATYRITAPANAKLLMLQSIGGNAVKYNPSVASDSTKAMIKTMPSTVYTFDGSKFYGDSEVSENLIVLNDVAETTVNGITYSVSGGIISIKGTATAQVNIELNINKTYSAGSYNYKVFNWTTGLGIDYFISNQNYAFDFYNTSGGSQSVKSMTFSGEELLRKAYFQIANGTAISGTLQLKPMLVKGTTAPTEFKVGFSGIHNIELTDIKSEGANLFDKTNVVADFPTYITTKIYIKPNTTYSFNRLVMGNGTAYYYNNNGDLLSEFSFTNFSTSLTTPYGCAYMYITVAKSLLDTAMIVYGTTAPTDYVPYVAPTTKTIDLTTIVDSNNNKLFPNGKLMGYNDLKDVVGVYNQESKWYEVDLGSLTYTKYEVTEGNLYRATLPVNSIYDTQNALCDRYEVTTRTSRANKMYYFNNDTVGASSTIGIWVDIIDNDYSTAESFKTAMSGVMLQYIRATPLTSNTDLSATLRNIQGYPNGSIIAENTHNMDVESVITYNSIIQETLCPSVTVDGANLCNIPNQTTTRTQVINTNGIVAKNGETYTISLNATAIASDSRVYLVLGSNATATIFDEIGQIQAQANTLIVGTRKSITLTATSDGYLYLYSVANGNAIFDVMLNYGSTALSYRPYKPSITRNLPTQASDGWSAGTSRNYRVFCDDEGNAVNKRYTNVDKGDMGTPTWNYNSTAQQFSTSVINDLKLGNWQVAGNILCKPYTTIAGTNLSSSDMCIALNDSTQNIFAKDSKYTDGATFKLANTNEPLYYELADTSKTETDMDDFDFFFDVEEGDIITFNNPYAQQVYATYSFLIKEAKSNE